MTNQQLLEKAWGKSQKAVDLLATLDVLTADHVKEIRKHHDLAGYALLELEIRLRGNVPPAKGDNEKAA